MNKSNTVVYWILSVVAFLAPIFFIPVSFISVQFVTTLLFGFGVIIAVMFYVGGTFFSGTLTLPKNSKHILPILSSVPVIYILAGISNGFSRIVFLGYTFDISTVGFMVLAFIFMFLVSVYFKDSYKIFYAYIGFVISALLVSVYMILRMIFGVKFLSFGLFNDLTSTVIGTWNSLGIFFGICALLSLLTHELLHVNKLVKIILTIALALSLFFLVLVNFSVIWIIIAVCSFLFILYKVINNHAFESPKILHKIKKIPLYPVIVLIIAVAFAIWGSSLGARLSAKFNVSNIDVRPTLSVTLDIARNTLKTRPLFGSGPNTFVTQWLSYKPSEVTGTVFWNTDFAYGIGLIPTFVVTTGLFGLLSWFLFFGFFVYLGVKAIFSKIDDSLVKYLLVSSFIISLYLWIMTWIYIPSAVILIITFFFTGLFFASTYVAGIISLEEKTFSHNPRTGFVWSLVLVVVFVACVSLGYGLYKNSHSLWLFQKSSFAANSGDIALAELNLNRAINDVPYDIYYRALAELELYKLKGIVSQDTTKVKIEEIQKQFNETFGAAVTAGLSAKNADQSNYLNWIELGTVYQSAVPAKVSGAYESANLAYNEALRRNPKNPGILMYFARLEIDKGNLDQAKNYVLQAIQMKQNYLDAYYLLSQIEVTNKNLKGAIDSVTAASIIDPTNSAVFFQLGLLKYNAQDYAGAVTAFEKSIDLVPDYANAKYFLGISYEAVGEHEKAIKQFQDLKVTNPDSKEVSTILTSLEQGKSIFSSLETSKPEKGTKLPVKEATQ